MNPDIKPQRGLRAVLGLCSLNPPADAFLPIFLWFFLVRFGLLIALLCVACAWSRWSPSRLLLHSAMLLTAVTPCESVALHDGRV